MCDQKRTFIAITVSGLKLTPCVKPIDWRGSSKKALLSFCDEVKKAAGFELHRVQYGLEPRHWKPRNDLGSGVVEIRIDNGNNQYRIMYVATFAESVYVLHCFAKKTQKTSRIDNEIVMLRYKEIVKERSLKDE
ncbi:type II toxin-antitoxin system RelE/ParE family toxin [Hafnia alvei]|uniref:Phage-related protein n=1 Tax=Hafnia alvei TaxID=569 RepID=A0A1C6Z1A4_HAFAL|nr:type II toxin-antitoxin system RelE/ParE family toxin [Hafnia alvei]NLS54012.1 addiction module toxin RelE [Hafnia alvei]SCM52759.1 Phage-related protein [Hafnia alvei]